MTITNSGPSKFNSLLLSSFSFYIHLFNKCFLIHPLMYSAKFRSNYKITIYQELFGWSKLDRQIYIISYNIDLYAKLLFCYYLHLWSEDTLLGVLQRSGRFNGIPGFFLLDFQYHHFPDEITQSSSGVTKWYARPWFFKDLWLKESKGGLSPCELWWNYPSAEFMQE